jgi:DNA anti-recombination protein RmuC
MAEVEIGGISFKGGRMLAVLMALSSAVGALYGGFEVYKDYMDMKEQISEYVAPDLSGINERISVLTETVASQDKTIEALDATVAAQAATVEAQAGSYNNTAALQRESINRIDGDLQNLFSDVRDSDKRLYELEKETSKELIDIRKSITEQIQLALDNPLSGQ